MVNNVEPEPEPELETCADWVVGNPCANGTTLTPGIGNSQSECCRSLTCADWDNDYDCGPGTTLTPETETVIGFTHGDCCRSLTCGEWNLDDNNCPDGKRPLSADTAGSSDPDCSSQESWI